MTDQNQFDQSQTNTPQFGQNPVGESLEEQNVFDLLGVADGTDEEREQFLDELQQVIWEDFLESDVELLVTVEEMAQVRSITDKNIGDLEKQEELIVYLEKLIPDLEEIMLEKALELKEDMMKERIAGMKEMFAGQEDKLSRIAEAEQLISQNKWNSAAGVLNTVN